MKKISMIGLSFLAVLATVTIMFFNACTSDPCKDVNCGTNGNCVDGTCVCSSGYEGTNCETEIRTKYIGSYTLSGSDNGGYTYTGLGATIATSSVDVTKMIFSLNGFTTTLPLTVTSSTAFTIDSTNDGTYTYTGSGSINGTTLSITINQTTNISGDLLILTLSGPKQ